MNKCYYCKKEIIKCETGWEVCKCEKAQKEWSIQMRIQDYKRCLSDLNSQLSKLKDSVKHSNTEVEDGIKEVIAEVEEMKIKDLKSKQFELACCKNMYPQGCCDICGKQEVYSKECFDCYIKGCNKELEKQRKEFITQGDKIFLSQNYGDDATNDEFDYALKSWEKLKEDVK